MHKNSWSDGRQVISYTQFIERTEMDGGDRKKVVGRLQDNPRQLGKGRARLVGAAPLKPARKFRERRQDSPVPLARSRVSVTRNQELGDEER